MNFLPLQMIVAYPPAVQIGYFAASLVIGLAGRNKNMGFWGYFLCSVLLSPVIGLMVLLVSGKKK